MNINSIFRVPFVFQECFKFEAEIKNRDLNSDSSALSREFFWDFVWHHEELPLLSHSQCEKELKFYELMITAGLEISEKRAMIKYLCKLMNKWLCKLRRR